MDRLRDPLISSVSLKLYWLQSINVTQENAWHFLTKLTDSLTFFIVFEGKDCQL